MTSRRAVDWNQVGAVLRLRVLQPADAADLLAHTADAAAAILHRLRLL